MKKQNRIFQFGKNRVENWFFEDRFTLLKPGENPGKKTDKNPYKNKQVVNTNEFDRRPGTAPQPPSNPTDATKKARDAGQKTASQAKKGVGKLSRTPGRRVAMRGLNTPQRPQVTPQLRRRLRERKRLSGLRERVTVSPKMIKSVEVALKSPEKAEALMNFINKMMEKGYSGNHKEWNQKCCKALGLKTRNSNRIARRYIRALQIVLNRAHAKRKRSDVFSSNGGAYSKIDGYCGPYTLLACRAYLIDKFKSDPKFQTLIKKKLKGKKIEEVIKRGDVSAEWRKKGRGKSFDISRRYFATRFLPAERNWAVGETVAKQVIGEVARKREIKSTVIDLMKMKTQKIEWKALQLAAKFKNELIQKVGWPKAKKLRDAFNEEVWKLRKKPGHKARLAKWVAEYFDKQGNIREHLKPGRQVDTKKKPSQVKQVIESNNIASPSAFLSLNMEYDKIRKEWAENKNELLNEAKKFAGPKRNWDWDYDVIDDGYTRPGSAPRRAYDLFDKAYKAFDAQRDVVDDNPTKTNLNKLETLRILRQKAVKRLISTIEKYYQNEFKIFHKVKDAYEKKVKELIAKHPLPVKLDYANIKIRLMGNSLDQMQSTLFRKHTLVARTEKKFLKKYFKKMPRKGFKTVEEMQKALKHPAMISLIRKKLRTTESHGNYFKQVNAIIAGNNINQIQTKLEHWFNPGKNHKDYYGNKIKTLQKMVDRNPNANVNKVSLSFEE